jgi:hypothetical protein
MFSGATTLKYVFRIKGLTDQCMVYGVLDIIITDGTAENRYNFQLDIQCQQHLLSSSYPIIVRTWNFTFAVKIFIA